MHACMHGVVVIVVVRELDGDCTVLLVLVWLTARLNTHIQGLAGEYGVTKNHSPIISELKAGVVQIVHEPVSAA